MGFQDRDYYRQRPPSGIGAVRVWSLTTWLIVANIAVFILEAFLLSVQRSSARTPEEFYHPVSLLQQYGAFTIRDTILHAQLWRLLTFQFLHAGLWHLLVNMIGLYMFGPVVELTLGTRRFALFYFLCGVAGPLMFITLWSLGILMPDPPGYQGIPATDVLSIPMVGASAGIFGILMAAAFLSPDRPIYIYFFELPLKVVAWGLMALAAYTILTNGGNAGGQAAHLGGGILGFLWIRNHGIFDVVTRRKKIRGRLVKDWSKDMNR